jgi:hypothetical protein
MLVQARFHIIHALMELAHLATQAMQIGLDGSRELLPVLTPKRKRQTGAVGLRQRLHKTPPSVRQVRVGHFYSQIKLILSSKKCQLIGKSGKALQRKNNMEADRCVLSVN